MKPARRSTEWALAHPERVEALIVLDAPDWWPIVTAISVVGALCGALYHGLRAARHDVIEALANE